MITSALVIFTMKDGRKYEIPCHRHANAFYIISQFCKSDEIDKEKTWQGFINHKGEYLDRLEARKDAFNWGQVEFNQGLLYSEDLW